MKGIKKEVIEKLDDDFAGIIKETCHNGDTETDHVHADHALLLLLEELGFEKVIEAYENVDKWLS